MADIKRAVAATAAGAEAAAAGAALTAALGSLSRASALPAAKTDYVAAVGALQEFVALSGLSSKIKGL